MGIPSTNKSAVEKKAYVRTYTLTDDKITDLVYDSKSDTYKLVSDGSDELSVLLDTKQASYGLRNSRFILAIMYILSSAQVYSIPGTKTRLFVLPSGTYICICKTYGVVFM